MAPRTLPGLGLSGFWTLGEDGWNTGADVNWRTLSALVQLSVISRTTALPGSPTNGDIYLVPSDAGAEPNKVAVRDNGAWVYLTPQEGWRAWVKDTDEMVTFSGTAWVASGAATIADNAVTNAKLADMATARIKGRTTAGTGDPEDLTGTQVTAMMDDFVGSGATHKKGLVPTPGATPGTTRYLREDGTWAVPPGGGGTPTESIIIAVGDETTPHTAGAGKVTFRMPYAFTLTAVRASLTTAQASGSIFTVDINEGGASILSTKLTIDNTEKTSTTAATPPVISDTSLADDAEITIDIEQIGNGTAAGLKIVLIGTKT
jgi:hypothetical protein